VKLETASFAPVIGKRMNESIKQIYPEAGISRHAALPIIDQFERTFNYLRIAINEQCNLHCIYCMPEEGIAFRKEEKLLSTNEIKRVLTIVAKMGVNKIRFTGGEPLLRSDLIELIQFANDQKGVRSTHITTNGLLLRKNIYQLEAAGLSGINISLDTLDRTKFKKITRRDGLQSVLDGIDAALDSAVPYIKINVVALREFNDDELLDFAAFTKDHPVTVRFIELMPFDAHQIWKTGKFYGAEKIVSDLKKLNGELETAEGSRTEHHIFKIKGHKGKIAVIPAYTRSLCGQCNCIRITADGKLMNCLYSHEEMNIRDTLRGGAAKKGIEKMIRSSIWKKPIDGWTAQKIGKDSRESMTQIGG
jgi:cyclic pyranopterin phosphate synthase